MYKNLPRPYIVVLLLLAIALSASLAIAARLTDTQLFGIPRSGSYLRTCNSIIGNVVRQQPILYAVCKNNSGGWVNTQIDLTSCPPSFTGLTNLNGYLACEVPTPPGSYSQTCSGIVVNYTTLVASCKDRNGNWHPTSISMDGCTIGFTNDNGTLRCGR